MPSIILAARGRITTHFGEDIGRGFPHRGIDQGHGDGNAVDLEIRAPAAGKVIAVGRDGSYGLRIIILHDDFTVSLLAHHARQFVAFGDRVAQRELIAEMGNTGTIYVHNHQEYRDKFGGQLDPLLHLATESAAISSLDVTPVPEVSLPNFGVKMPARFITRDGVSPWFITDGLTKRLVADWKESQALVDCGLAIFEEKTNGVNVVGGLVDTIPSA